MTAPGESRRPLERRVGEHESRKLRARREGREAAWFGLGMFGLVGWTVAVPTLIGVAIGVWIDSRAHDGYSWTLMLMVLGLGIGCANAWNWVVREGRHRPNATPPRTEDESSKPSNS